MKKKKKWGREDVNSIIQKLKTGTFSVTSILIGIEDTVKIAVKKLGCSKLRCVIFFFPSTTLKLTFSALELFFLFFYIYLYKP